MYMYISRQTYTNNTIFSFNLTEEVQAVIIVSNVININTPVTRPTSKIQQFILMDAYNQYKTFHCRVIHLNINVYQKNYKYTPNKSILPVINTCSLNDVLVLKTITSTCYDNRYCHAWSTLCKYKLSYDRIYVITNQ